MGALCPTTTPTSTFRRTFHHFNSPLQPLRLPIDSRCLYFPPLPTNRHLRQRLSLAALSPPPPPPSEPPPDKDPVRLKGAIATLSRFPDKVRIFFAVLFWLSLFFWASAWDGRNGGSGRLNKGSRFRR